MTTQEVASRYYELSKQNKGAEIWDELYAPDVVNKEPEHALAIGIPTTTKGMDAIRAKAAARRETIQEIHAGTCSEPLVAGNFFSVVLTRDVTFKGKPRVTLIEIGVFEVKNDKIVLEQFFY